MKEKCPDFIIAGLGFGDEGKGTITDYLVNKYNITGVIRYNGGSQAAHTVVTPDGISHTFSQFGSGAFIKDTRTFLSSQMLIDPYSLLEEDFILKQKGIFDAMKRLTIDRNCMIITPLHKMLGRMQELVRGKERNGSTGKGVGQAVLDLVNNKEYVLYVNDFFLKEDLKMKLESHYSDKLTSAENVLSLSHSSDVKRIYLYFKNKYNPSKLFHFYNGFANSYSNCIDRKGNYLTNLFKSKSSLLFEGAQGALLDPEFGFSPFITKTNTKLAYAENLYLPIKSNRTPIQIGVLRAYSHRHGKGPLPTESKYLSRKIHEEHNVNNPWQGLFRIGWLDLILCRYGIRMNNCVESIALTCIDQLTGLTKIKVCISYIYTGIWEDAIAYFFQLEKAKNTVKITGINLLTNITTEERIKLTGILLQCKPLEYLEFKGWKENLDLVQYARDLPRNVKIYLEYLESKEGFNLPISILSLGKTRNHKIVATTLP